MQRIILSVVFIAGALGVIATGSTGAFFTDTQVSAGNTFSAGSIKLSVDNDSYYDGNHCTNVGTTSSTNYEWVGSGLFPVPGTACDTSWSLTNLTIQKFFDFLDLKPGDYGEDTISLHVDTNDAYLCADVKLTSNKDANGNDGQGLLANDINFIMWADDGNNVLEKNEPVLYNGPIGALGTGGQITIPLADSATNIWTGTGGPAPHGVTQYIGKAWCFGKITPTPVSPGTGDPSTNPGYTCAPVQSDGVTQLGNETQNNSLTADISFNATQSRNNSGYLCVPPRATAKLTVVKTVVNLPNSGNKSVSDFDYFVDDGIVTTQVSSGATTTLPPGNYNVSEAGPDGYQATFGGACDAFGNVSVAANDNKTCTILNTELPAHITLKKVVTGTGTLAGTSTFGLEVDGSIVPTGQSIAVTANHAHVINEVGRPGYTFVSITGDSACPSVLGGTATLSEGQAITCTITNHKN